MLFCMRVMVGVIILYDHVHPVGAFAKTSKIDVSILGFDFCSPEVNKRACLGGPLTWGLVISVLIGRLMPADEGLHQGAEGAAVQQRGGSPQRTEVGVSARIPAARKRPHVSPYLPSLKVHDTTSKR